jgi:hypothetical protein
VLHQRTRAVLRPARSRGRALSTTGRITAALVCCGLLVACTEEDENVLDDVGVVRLALVDAAARTQSALLHPPKGVVVDITDPNLPPVGAQWEVTALRVTVGDDPPLDLHDGGACIFTSHDFYVSPFATGPCADGFIVRSSDPVSVRVEATISRAQLLRARPADPPGCIDPPPTPPDVDTDCDNDEVTDTADGCAWFPIDPLTFTHRFAFDTTISDGIGDECQEESLIAAPATIDVTIPVVSAPRDAVGYIVIDLGSDRTVDGATWGPPASAGSFTLDGSEARACFTTSGLAAAAGCPDAP